MLGIRATNKLIVIVASLALAGAAAWHYRSVLADRAVLRMDNQVLKSQLLEAAADLDAERRAVASVRLQRDSAQAALNLLRSGRDGDEDAQQWAAQSLPPGELARLCEAMPWLSGCQDE